MLLEVKNLQVSYGDAIAIRDASLEVAQGEIVGIIGPNGAGKSTLINTIAGLLRASGGDIIFGSENITALNRHRFVERGVALVPEGRRLFAKMTVLENLEMGAYSSQARKHIGDSLAYVFSLFPILKEKSGQAAGHLSGGQQQMVAIGRALLAKPKVLLMDEPSLGLAPVIVSEMFAAIQTVNRRGISVILVEQNAVKALQIANRAYVLEGGRIVASGRAADLLNRPEVRAAYLGV
jgi:branched-chain amino acid transport system ATP-binding protein